MKPGPPITSFLIPVYNGEAYLAESLESALAQTETNIEVVVVDDGSTDSTPEILRRYAAQDARVRVFEEDHKGLVAALNRGLEVARGKYICRLDADDIATSDRVEKQVKFLEEHPDHVLVGGQVTTIGEAGEKIGIWEQPLSHATVLASLKKESCLQHSSVMFRRAEVLCEGGYNPLFMPAEDYDLWVRLAETARIANIPDFVCLHRCHENSVTYKNFLRQSFIVMCVRASFRGASREMIGNCVQATEKEFFPSLRKLGYRDKEISEEIAGRGLPNVAILNAAGNREPALRILSELSGHLKELKDSSPYLAQAYSWEFRVSLGARNYPRAARSLLLAFTYAPAKTARNVLTRLFAPQAILRQARTER